MRCAGERTGDVRGEETDEPHAAHHCSGHRRHHATRWILHRSLNGAGTAELLAPSRRGNERDERCEDRDPRQNSLPELPRTHKASLPHIGCIRYGPYQGGPYHRDENRMNGPEWAVSGCLGRMTGAGCALQIGGVAETAAGVHIPTME